MNEKLQGALLRINCGGFCRIKADEVSNEKELLHGNNGINISSHDQPLLLSFILIAASQALLLHCT